MHLKRHAKNKKEGDACYQECVGPVISSLTDSNHRVTLVKYITKIKNKDLVEEISHRIFLLNQK
jgi:hypothetical protein